MKDREGQIRKPLYAREGFSSFIVSIITVILGVIAGSILILAIGKNPFVAFEKIIFGALSNTRRIGNTLAYSTQLILVGLSVSFAFKTGLFNIGGAGQMLVGGLAASLFAHKVTFLPAPLHYLALILIAGAAGALWGYIPGLLKAKFNVHEVVGTIMLNWTAFWIVYDWVKWFIADPAIVVKSAPIPMDKGLRAPWLQEITGYSFFNYGFFIAVISVVVVWFLLEKTSFGFKLKAVGSNKYCAEYAGININRSIPASMAIAGCLAGLAGLTYFLGFSNIMEIGRMPSEGFDGIAVALLGNSSPIGVFFAAIFFGILKMGKGSLAATGIPTEIADTIIAIIIYFTATAVLIKNFYFRIVKNREERKQMKDSNKVKEGK